MPKPKAPEWLRLAFRDGVDEREGGPFATCWLAQFDPSGRPCSGKLERLHLINRQRVENALWALLGPSTFPWGSFEEGWNPLAVIQLAAWDPRNGGIGCEGHHRPFDSHLVPLPAERLVVPPSALPSHFLEFIGDYGLETSAEERFPGFRPSEYREPA